MNRISILIAAILVSASANAFAATQSRYGVIEVGSKGVRGYAFDLDKARTDPACNVTDESFLKCLAPKTYSNNVSPIQARKTDPANRKVTAAELASYNDLIAAVSDMKKQLAANNGVTADKLYVVGSSGVATGDLQQQDDMKTGIDAALALPPGHEMTFVTAQEEAAYAFQGVMAMLPAKVQALREQQALVIDFGSGNTKGSFRDTTQPGAPLRSFSIDYGTKKITDLVNKSRGSEPFVSAVEKFRDAEIVPEVRRAFDNVPAATSRPRVYIIGGIAWALSNLSAPQKYSLKFPPVTTGEIDSLYKRLTAPDALASVCGGTPVGGVDPAVNPDIKAVCNTFSIENLIGGMQLIKAYANETHFDSKGKNVFFFRDSLYAWPMGFLKAKVVN